MSQTPTPINPVVMSFGYMKEYMCHKFWDPNGQQNLEEEEDISGQIVIVTGSNAGIGREAALQLAKRGAKVIMACRDMEKAQTALEYIKSKVPKADIEIIKLDLGDKESIRIFVKEFTSKYDKLNILINNAGYMASDGVVKKTKDGFEYHMGVNHLGPFLLTRLLLDSLKKGAPSKIVSIASSNIMLNALNLEDLMMEKVVRYGDEPYNVSKLANAMCIRRLASTLNESDGIRVYNLCPGFVKTDIFRNEHGFRAFARKMLVNTIGLSPENGCETIIYCAVSKTLSADPKYGKGEMHRFRNYQERSSSYLDPNDSQTIKLYEMSESLVDLKN